MTQSVSHDKFIQVQYALQVLQWKMFHWSLFVGKNKVHINFVNNPLTVQTWCIKLIKLWNQCFKKNLSLMYVFFIVVCLFKKKKNKQQTEITEDSLLLIFSFSLSVHHFPETAKDFTLSLSSLFLVKRCECSLLVGTVDLVFLSQTHSLHTPMSEGVKHLIISISIN